MDVLSVGVETVYTETSGLDKRNELKKVQGTQENNSTLYSEVSASAASGSGVASS